MLLIKDISSSSQEEVMSSECAELNTMLQHSETNCEGTETASALEEVDDYIVGNRKLLGSAYCAPELREETPGREESRTDPPDGQQDLESEKNKEKTLGIWDEISSYFSFLK